MLIFGLTMISVVAMHMQNEPGDEDSTALDTTSALALGLGALTAYAGYLGT